jgi:hypothetical protein
VRLVGAELRTLARPLTAVVALAFVALVVALALATAWSTDEHAAALARSGAPEDQEGLVEPVGGELDAAARDLAAAAALRHPLGAGAFAAGHAASLPGALAVLVLAGAHVGGGVRGRTIGQVLLQQGRRGRVLAARALALWLTAAGLLAAAWAALALLAVGLRLAEGELAPVAPLTPGAALAASAGRVVPALAVLAAFVVAGVLAGVATGSAPATFAAGTAALALALGLAGGGRPGLRPASPATWVAAAMGFHEPTFVPDHLWVGLAPGTAMGAGAAVAGLAAAATLALLAAAIRFDRADVRM